MNLSETNYKDILLKYNKETIENMVFLKKMFVEDTKSDIGIVFGGISMIPYRLEEAIRLYKEGLIKKILVTGGIGRLNVDRITPEAIKMQYYLVNHDIPVNDIIIEREAKNSYENVKYSLNLIEEKYSLKNTRISLITSDFHMKRCMLMMAQFLDFATYTPQSVKDGITDLEHWKNGLLGKRVIYQEALLLSYYDKHHRIKEETFEIVKRKRNF